MIFVFTKIIHVKMASRVKGIDEDILYHARNEFLEKGYNDASLRNIAQNAGVSTSTIYTRYSDKAGLFRYLVQPALNAMWEFMNRSLDRFKNLPVEEQKQRCKEYSDGGIPALVDFMYEHFQEFKLLVKCSPSSLYNDLLEDLVEIDMWYMKEFLKNINSKAYLDGTITDGFLRVISSAFYAGVFEVVKHDMPKEKALNYIKKLRKFYHSGWEEYL